MKHLLVLFLLSASLLETSIAENSDAVVFVHGLGGWGPTEFLGFPYWTYKGELDAAGFPTFVATMGKFTSNWDRACELYAQIVGTKVDYGVCHATQYGHHRFGKDFTGKGLYPSWGPSKKVHLIGHSMGGQTMRMIEHLLREGSGCAQDTSPLFTGGKKWITSITSISGTLDGTTFVDIMGEDFSNFVRDLVVALAAFIDNGPLDDVYNIDMTQWDLERNAGESFLTFWKRAQSAGVMTPNNQDFSMYDLSQAGARRLNNMMVQAYPETYYFSVATERTDPKRDCFLFWCGEYYETPNSFMFIFLQFSASIIGNGPEQTKQKNDGLVPWYNQLCPTAASYGQTSCTEYTGTWRPGKWYYFNADALDHLQIILPGGLTDIFDYYNSPKRIYRDIATRLKALPSSTTTSLSSAVEAEETSVGQENVDIQYLATAIKHDNSEDKKEFNNLFIGFVAAVAFLFLFSLFITRRYVYSRKVTQKQETVAATTRKSMRQRSSVDHYLSEFGEVQPAETVFEVESQNHGNVEANHSSNSFANENGVVRQSERTGRVSVHKSENPLFENEV